MKGKVVAVALLVIFEAVPLAHGGPVPNLRQQAVEELGDFSGSNSQTLGFEVPDSFPSIINSCPSGQAGQSYLCQLVIIDPENDPFFIELDPSSTCNWATLDTEGLLIFGVPTADDVTPECNMVIRLSDSGSAPLDTVQSVPIQVQAAPSHSAIEVGANALGPEHVTYARGVSDVGQVIGEIRYNYSTTNVSHLMYSDEAIAANGAMYDLHEPEFEESIGIDMNANGNILVQTYNPWGYYIRQVDGQLSQLEPLGGYTDLRAEAISEKGGIVVGTSFTATDEQATYWTTFGGTARPINPGTPNDIGGWDLLEGHHVSSNGQYMSGYAKHVSGEGAGTFLAHLVDGEIEVLEIIPSNFSILLVNDSGTVAGTTEVSIDGSEYQRAFIKRIDSPIEILGTLGGAESGARAINDCDEVSGWSDTLDTSWTAPFLWSSGDGLRNFLDLIPPSVRERIVYMGRSGGYLINNYGQYVLNGLSELQENESLNAWIFSPNEPYECGGAGGPSTAESSPHNTFVVGGFDALPRLQSTPFCQYIQQLIDEGVELEDEVAYWIGECAREDVENTCETLTTNNLTLFEYAASLFGFHTPVTNPISEHCAQIMIGNHEAVAESEQRLLGGG